MANLGQTYNAGDLPESRSFDLIPAGWYEATITGSQAKFKDSAGREVAEGHGDRMRLTITYTITGPTHQGRLVFQGLNLRNPSPKAQEISLAQLNQILTAVGKASIQDSTELHGSGVRIKVKIKSDKAGKYEDQNEVAEVQAISGGVVRNTQAQPANSPPAASQRNDNTPPW